MPLLRGYPRSDVRHVPVVREKLGLADARSRDLDDGVPRMRDLWHGWFMVDADPQRPPVNHGHHGCGSFRFRLPYSFARRAKGDRQRYLWLTWAAPRSIAYHARI